MLVIGTTLITLKHEITHLFFQFLPLSATIRSAGSIAPAFLDDNGFSLQLFRIGILFISTPFLIMCCAKPLFQDSYFSPVRTRQIFLLFLTLSTLVYFYFSYPPNMWTANSRFLWVDAWTTNHVFFSTYTLICSLHYLFFDFPAHLVALSSLIFFTSAYFLLRTFNIPGVLAVFATTTLTLSSNLTNFANVSEGLIINVTILTLSLLAYSKRPAYLVGIVFFITTLGRPQYLAILGAFIFAELYIEKNDKSYFSNLIEHFRGKFITSNFISFSTCYIFWQITSMLLDINLFSFVSGEAATFLAKNKPLPIGGFTIFPLSGTYFFHYLWHFPIIISLTSILCGVYFFDCPMKLKKLYLFTYSFTLANVLLHELFPVFYYNIRYLSYFFPLLYLVSFLIINEITKKTRFRWLLIPFCLSSFTVSSSALQVRDAAQNYVLTPLFEHRHALRQWTASSEHVYSAYNNKGAMNYLSYIFEHPETVKKYNPEIRPEKGLYILRRKPSFPCDNHLILPRIYICQITRVKNSQKE